MISLNYYKIKLFYFLSLTFIPICSHFASQVWNLTFPSNPSLQFPSILHFLKHLRTISTSQLPFLEIALTAAYSLWKQRNSIIFRNQAPAAPKVVFSAANLFKHYQNCHLITSHKHFFSTTVFKWYPPPPPNCLKLNFDGSVINHSAASGFIFRNSEGNPILASTKHVGEQDILTAEALVLRAGLTAAWYHNFTHFQVEGDSKTLIDSINGTIPCPWRIITLVRDIKHLAQFAYGANDII